MFGFLSGVVNDCRYRKVYARCCSIQHGEYGLRSLPFVSYEAVFLHCVGIDLGWLPEPRSDDPRCCRLRKRVHRQWTAAERESARFGAAAAMLLAETKINDDIADSRSVAAWSASRVLRSRFRKMKRYFADFDSSFAGSIESCLIDHARLEKSSHSPAIADYCQPTSRAFGLLFELYGKVIGASTSHCQLYGLLGRQIGAAIIAFDCAYDWRKDRKRRHYNPLDSIREVEQSMRHSTSQLAAAGWAISDASGSAGIAAAVLRQRMAKNAAWQPLLTGQSPPGAGRPSLQIRGLRPRPGFCDCDCDCGGCDVDDVCDCSDACYVPCDVCCCEKTNSKKKQLNQVADATPESSNHRIGQTGVATTDLVPYGTIEIDGAQLAAKSDSSPIDRGQAVTVMGTGSFGLIVRATPGDDLPKS